MVATSWNAYKMCKNTRFVFLVLSPYSHAYPLSQKYTASVWFSRVFKLSLSGVSACVHVYAQNIASNTKEKPLKFQSRVVESSWIFGLKKCTNPAPYFSGKQYCC